MEDVACLLDVLIPGNGFCSGLLTKQPGLSIGISSERLAPITDEEEALFTQVQDRLSSITGAKDVRVPQHKQAKDEGCADVIMETGLKEAWKTYLKDVDGSIRSLQDLVNWHSEHPVNLPLEKPTVSG